ncbi:MAG: rod shape-determining protein RodA [Patescibacteria group bacterium]
MFKAFIKQDFILTITIVLLMIIGIVTISSTNNSYIAERQTIFMILGLIIYFFLMGIDYNIYKYKSIQAIGYVAVFILLILIYILNIKLNNTHRWFTLGGIDIQPAEFAKIVIIIITASFFTLFQKGENIIKKILLGFLIILPIVALVFKQPALGTSIVIVVIWAAIVFAAYYDQIKLIIIFLTFIVSSLFITIFIGINFLSANLNLIFFKINIALFLIFLALETILYKLSRKKMYSYLFLGIVLFGIIFGSTFKFVVWDHLMKNYQKQRIVGFLSSSSSNYSNSLNFQTTQSKIAIGSGGLWGQGYGKGTQSSLNFLPEDTTDFIYSTFIEDFGFIGNIVFMFLYIVLFSRLLFILKNTENKFAFLLVFGIITMIFFQFLINIGMSIGFVPVTGIPLPLVSYGGSSLITILISLGIIQNIHTKNRL